MKTKSIGIGVAIAWLVSGAVFADAVVHPKEIHLHGQATKAASAGELLSQAYAALHAADHDYQGHRIAAMRQIEAAAKEMGITDLKGDGHGGEAQVTSDQQLRKAQGLLQEALTELQKNTEPVVREKAKRHEGKAIRHEGKEVKHVEKAIEDITIALSIK